MAFKKEHIVFDDLYEEVDEHNAYLYDSHDKINIVDYVVYSDMIRVTYWVYAGEFRQYDIKPEDYVSNVRNKKLRKLGIESVL